MKKIFLLLTAVAGMALTQSCEGDAGPQGEQGTALVADVYEITNVDFVNDGTDFYGIVYQFPQIYEGDMVLAYRLKGSTTGGADIWESIPKTYYFLSGELEYNFDFTRSDISIYLDQSNDSVLTPAYTQDQVFRVVIVPGDLANKMTSTKYNDVVQMLKLSDSSFKRVTSTSTK
ncbi:hypothetical protein FNO01nite_20390 [Flavobacterium noncentrifugens]|uniref:Uncharacterized protein n=1 Tax=Flavobacterium noncentrifugens TaxID=1128970 RepID=A0A1G8YUI2_9FLAO|nr:hypothetical protein [Flavobacterium noncentrifugens]GEP51367.1 hypothetical protein FNO01nite_20390 [Flavobacterium noncentrifugens]SDK06522.1 hypothetical protein SAMN04487935_2484 [Flavobacterium noncentrifugens]